MIFNVLHHQALVHPENDSNNIKTAFHQYEHGCNTRVRGWFTTRIGGSLQRKLRFSMPHEEIVCDGLQNKVSLITILYARDLFTVTFPPLAYLALSSLLPIFTVRPLSFSSDQKETNRPKHQVRSCATSTIHNCENRSLWVIRCILLVLSESR